MGDLMQKKFLMQLFKVKVNTIYLRNIDFIRPNLWSKTVQLTSRYESNLHSVRL